MKLAALLFALLAVPAIAQAQEQPFGVWLDGIRQEAIAAGIRPATVERALSQVQPLSRVIELDRRQAEFTQTLHGYLGGRLTERRIEEGRALYRRNAKLLERIERASGVPGRILIAFWGLESDYGKVQGDIPTLSALATLAHEGRRAELFRPELINALAILDEGHISQERMRGSWAGAMGHVQFMPSTFRAHAVDATGDSRKDIWNSEADALTSAAAYLRALGWDPTSIWGREVSLPQGFDYRVAGLNRKRALDDWARLGVRRADGGKLPQAELEAALLLPAGAAGPAFLVYRNFDIILRWNRSLNYALSVALLSDRIAGGGPLVNPPPADEQPLSRETVLALQQGLNERGFSAGEPDGLLGSRTAAALQEFQAANNLPADGHPSGETLARLGLAPGTSTNISRPPQPVAPVLAVPPTSQ